MPVPFLNSLAGLRLRRAAAASPDLVAALDKRIAEVEARLLSLPQYLSLEIREEIVELEGQLRLHEARLVGNVERDCDAIRARIAELTRQGHAEAMAAGFARLDATLAKLAAPLDTPSPRDVLEPKRLTLVEPAPQLARFDHD
jgi:hypothetical protein